MGELRDGFEFQAVGAALQFPLVGLGCWGKVPRELDLTCLGTSRQLQGFVDGQYDQATGAFVGGHRSETAEAADDVEACVRDAATDAVAGLGEGGAGRPKVGGGVVGFVGASIGESAGGVEEAAVRGACKDVAGGVHARARLPGVGRDVVGFQGIYGPCDVTAKDIHFAANESGRAFVAGGGRCSAGRPSVGGDVVNLHDVQQAAVPAACDINLVVVGH
jgi:hypothetical protein